MVAIHCIATRIKSRAQRVPHKPIQYIAVPATCTNMDFGFFDFDGDSGRGGGDLDKLMSEFNSKYTLCLLGRNVMVAVHDVSISTGVTFMQVAQWSTFNCHITVEITGDNGKPKTTPFTSVWLKSPKANRCTKVEFLPA